MILMKKIKIYPSGPALIVLFSILFFSSPLFAKESMTKQLVKEKKDFYNNQITIDNKLFLNQVETNLHYLITINNYTIKVLNSLSTISELSYSNFINILRKKTKKIIPELTNFKKSGQSIKRFIEERFVQENNLVDNLNQLVSKYQEIKKLDPSLNNFGRDFPSEGSYHYYELLSKNLEYTPLEILKQMNTTCRNLGEFAMKYKIESLKNLLPEKILFLEKSYNEITDYLIINLKYLSNNWGRKMILQAIELAQQQILLTKNFISSVSIKLDSIATPQNAKSPDLEVVSIEMTFKEKVKIGTEVNIAITIKNTGDLTVGFSKAKVTLPDNTTKIFDVPELKSAQTYVEHLKYKLSALGKNQFKVRANSGFKTWESNISNNVTKRALILQ